MTRDMADKFNNTYGEVLKLPEEYILPEVESVPGIDGQKMSKSYGNTIDIFMDYRELKSLVMGIVTDSTPLEEPKDPDKSTIYLLYKLFATPEENEAMREKYKAGGYGYGHAKKELLGKIQAYFEDQRKRREELANNLDYVKEVLKIGAERARNRAGKVMARVRAASGVLKFH